MVGELIRKLLNLPIGGLVEYARNPVWIVRLHRVAKREEGLGSLNVNRSALPAILMIVLRPYKLDGRDRGLSYTLNPKNLFGHEKLGISTSFLQGMHC